MNILVVEDEDDLLHEIVKCLRRNKHEVMTAGNGLLGWDVFRECAETFDAVLTDVKMPVMDGLTLLQKVREKHSKIPVIIMTGHGDLEMSIQALRMGAFDFLVKPFDPELLEQALEKLNSIRQAPVMETDLLASIREVHLDFPSETQAIPRIQAYLKDYYTAVCMPYPINTNHVGLCLHEALTNAVIHGNLQVDSVLKERSWENFEALIRTRENDPEFKMRRVHVSYRVHSDAVEFEIRDEGNGFDLGNLPNPNDPLALLSSGRGLILIRSFMDRVEWNESGNQIRMFKELKRHESD